MAPIGAELVFGDVHVAHKQFVADEGTPGVAQVGLPLADALYLAAHQHDARRVLVHQKVFVRGTFVLDFYDILLFHNILLDNGMNCFLL